VTMTALVLLSVAGAGFLVRAGRGPSLADRVLAVDAFLTVAMAGLAVGAVRTGTDLFVVVAVVIGLLGFVGTCVAARFIEGRGA
jgi:multicomponent Na+:H+ antiporter subunit F